MRHPRGRMPSPKSGQIVVAWATEKHSDSELVYCRKGSPLMSRDTNMLSHFFQTQLGMFDRTLTEELQARGYDMSTFRFSIQKLPEEVVEAKPEDGSAPQPDAFYAKPQ